MEDTLARADTALRTAEALQNEVQPAIDGAVAVESGRESAWGPANTGAVRTAGSAP